MEKLEELAAARDITAKNTESVGAYVKSGAPYVWTTAAAISVAFIITLSLLVLTASRGLPHFWPQDLVQAEYRQPGQPAIPMLVEVRSAEEVTSARLVSAGLPVDASQAFYDRLLVKLGNRDIYGVDFRYVLSDWLVERSQPENATVFERLEWGNFHGFIESVQSDGTVVARGDAAWDAYLPMQERANDLRARIISIQKGAIGDINFALERVRLDTRRLELSGKTRDSHPQDYARLDQRRTELDGDYQEQLAELRQLDTELRRDVVVVRTVEGSTVELPLSKVVHGFQPNRMGLFGKLGHFFGKIWEFVSDQPREANTEVMLMSVIVTPFGILAALYLREYARQGPLTQAIRIAVNNLAGVPSIVFGMFGLGFFVYFVGGSLDRLFYPESAPAPVFGTPGLLWASLTLALLTLPVVIVATEEGLARIPRSIREASLSLGATKAETLWRVVLPMASPAMMTGLILAIARAAGEVAPLMLVGVVKLAPTLPLDGNFPFLHLERKFMHLGFHIYDVGFQSPNVEAARPLVYATAFLLVLVILVLNLAAIRIRNQLRERYKALEH
jgi:phosphate transport system permease protein